MKHLNQFITEYIVKKKLDKFVDSENHYKYCPKTKRELIGNIKELFDKGETNLNCIDTSNIIDMSYLFKTLNILSVLSINLDISKWNVSNVKDMSYMFFGCKSFDGDLSSWDVSNVETMEYMFTNCKNFTGKGLENWNVSNVINMESMFMGCENFDGDLSKWDVSKAEYLEFMFYKCEKFDCDLSSWNIDNAKTTTNNMFSYCTSLKNKPSWYEE